MNSWKKDISVTVTVREREKKERKTRERKTRQQQRNENKVVLSWRRMWRNWKKKRMKKEREKKKNRKTKEGENRESNGNKRLFPHNKDLVSSPSHIILFLAPLPCVSAISPASHCCTYITTSLQPLGYCFWEGFMRREPSVTSTMQHGIMVSQLHSSVH